MPSTAADNLYDQPMRINQAEALGGLRALDTFTIERFASTERNLTAFEAAKNFLFNKENLFFWGSTGSGKSHLAAIAARKYLSANRHRPQPIITTNQMVVSRSVRSAADALQENREISDLVNVPILVIDDLGVGKDTEFSLNLLYEIIHGRYMNKPGGLIVTSNLSLGTLAEKVGDDRIASRLAQMCKVFPLSGQDKRLEKHGV